MLIVLLHLAELILCCLFHWLDLVLHMRISIQRIFQPIHRPSSVEWPYQHLAPLRHRQLERRNFESLRRLYRLPICLQDSFCKCSLVVAGNLLRRLATSNWNDSEEKLFIFSCDCRNKMLKSFALFLGSYLFHQLTISNHVNDITLFGTFTSFGFCILLFRVWCIITFDGIRIILCFALHCNKLFVFPPKKRNSEQTKSKTN